MVFNNLHKRIDTLEVNMKKTRSLVFLLVALVLVFSTGTVFGQGGDDAAPEGPAQISMLYSDNAGFPFNPEWPIIEKMQELGNVELDIQVVPLTDYATKAQLLINAGEAPDIITFASTIAANVRNSGALLDVWELMEDGKLPYMKARLDDWDVWSEVENLRSDDGSLYVFPSFQELQLSNFGMIMREDLLQAFGMPAPTTTDELFNFMSILKSQFPKALPMGNFYGMPVLLYAVGPWFGLPIDLFDPGYAADYDTNTYISPYTSYRTKEMLMWLNKCYESGLFDPESFTQSAEQFVTKAVMQTTLVLLAWTDQNELVEGAARPYYEPFDLKIYPPVSSAVSTPATQTYTRVDVTHWACPATVAKKPYFDELIAFIDWYAYSDEGLALQGWGIEGGSYNVTDGRKQWSDEILGYEDLSIVKAMQIYYGGFNNSFTVLTSKEVKKAAYPQEIVDYTEQIGDMGILRTPLASPKFNIDDQEDISRLVFLVKDTAMQAIQQFIMGERSFDEWDEYVADLDEKGAQTIADMVNANIAAQ
jgi:putative aldouronate transport system substrate-binding protein